jgi:Na+/H+ antiporter NhaB
MKKKPVEARIDKGELALRNINERIEYAGIFFMCSMLFVIFTYMLLNYKPTCGTDVISCLPCSALVAIGVVDVGVICMGIAGFFQIIQKVCLNCGHIDNHHEESWWVRKCDAEDCSCRKKVV